MIVVSVGPYWLWTMARGNTAGQSRTRSSASASPPQNTCSMVVHGVVDVPYFKNDLSLEFWTLAALTCAGTVWASPPRSAERSEGLRVPLPAAKPLPAP